MYRKQSSKRGTQRFSSMLRKGKSFQSLDVIPPERPLLQKLMFWKRPCIPRKNSPRHEGTTSGESLEHTVLFEPAAPLTQEKSGLTASDESSGSMGSAAPVSTTPPPPPPPPPDDDHDEEEEAVLVGEDDPPAVDPPQADQDDTPSVTPPPRRPPLARRSVTVQEPPRRSVATAATASALTPPALARGVSYNTSGSRHSRRNAEELPSLQQVFGAQDDTNVQSQRTDPPRIPLSICARPRLVSALADDDEDEDDANFVAEFRSMGSYDYSDDDDDEDVDVSKQENQDGSASPDSVIKESNSMPTSDLWMQAWVNQNASHAVTSVDIANEDDNDSAVIFDGLDVTSGDDDSGCTSSSTTIAYLPVEPVPKALKNKTDDNDVVFVCGWTAVLLNEDIVTAKYSCDDDSEEASKLPSLDLSAIYYVRLLRSGHLHLISLVQGQEQMIEIDNRSMRMEYVHKSAGHCLLLQGEGSETIALLPVNLPPSYLLGRRSTKKQIQPRFFAPFQGSNSDDDDECENYDRYAPQAQHDAVLQLRFAMEAALRATLLPRC